MALTVRFPLGQRAFRRRRGLREAARRRPSDYGRARVPWEAAFLAAKAFVRYRRRGGEQSAPLPDFFIGAHAAVGDLTLLTRDASHHRTHFPTVGLATPDA